MGSDLVSVSSVPILKSSAADLYNETEATKNKNINDSNFHIKYLSKYSINCLKDDSDADIWATLGIGVLNIIGLFTATSIDFPEHWFLIAEATDLPNDSDKETKIYYYLIEKTEQSRGITRYNSIDEILENEKKSYHDNKVNFCGKWTPKQKITIRDIDNYIDTLSNS